MPEKGEKSSDQRAEEAKEMPAEASKKDKLASQAPSRLERQLLALLEDLLQGKHRVLIDGKALPLSETAHRLAALNYKFVNEFQGVVRDAVQEAKYRRATWENPLTGPGTWGFPSDYWVHFELDVDTSIPHMGYPKGFRCEEKSCPENK